MHRARVTDSSFIKTKKQTLKARVVHTKISHALPLRETCIHSASLQLVAWHSTERLTSAAHTDTQHKRYWKVQDSADKRPHHPKVQNYMITSEFHNLESTPGFCFENVEWEVQLSRNYPSLAIPAIIQAEHNSLLHCFTKSSMISTGLPMTRLPALQPLL
jgi:hypothetical protein